MLSCCVHASYHPMEQNITSNHFSALGKREDLLITEAFSYFSCSYNVVDPHLRRLVEIVHMNAHNMFFMKNKRNILHYQ